MRYLWVYFPIKEITFYKDNKSCLQPQEFILGENLVLDKKILVTKDKTQNFLRFDITKLPSGCVIRSRQEGDEFTPFGGNNKKLKKYLIDKKIPKRKRDNLLLVAKDNIVYIIIGLEISNLIKLENNENAYYIGEKF